MWFIIWGLGIRSRSHEFCELHELHELCELREMTSIVDGIEMAFR